MTAPAEAELVAAAQAAYSDGTGGLAMPPQLERDIEWADAEADKIATGRRFLGATAGSAQPALRQPVGVVDWDPLGTGVSITAFLSAELP